MYEIRVVQGLIRCDLCFVPRPSLLTITTILPYLLSLWNAGATGGTQQLSTYKLPRQLQSGTLHIPERAPEISFEVTMQRYVVSLESCTSWTHRMLLNVGSLSATSLTKHPLPSRPNHAREGQFLVSSGRRPCTANSGRDLSVGQRPQASVRVYRRSSRNPLAHGDGISPPMQRERDQRDR